MNKTLITNISLSTKTLQLEINGGKNISNLEATFSKLKVWFNDKAIANMLIHSLVADDHLAVSDSRHNSSFFICMGA